MKKFEILLLLTVFFICQAAHAQTPKTFQWIGGPTYVLHLGSFKVLTDPMLSPKSDTAFIIKQHPTTGAMNAWIARYIAPASFDTSNIDLLLISHPHADHIDREAKETLNKELFVIAPKVDINTIQSWGFQHITGLSWGDSSMLIKGKETLRIIAVQARHAANDPLRSALGKGNGYIIEYSDGTSVYRIYWMGDTVWFDEIADIAKYGKINLLVPDMGAVGSDGKIGRRGLNAVECLKVATTLHPDLIIPVHHTTFSMYVEPIGVLQQTMNESSSKSKLKILTTGQIFKL